MPRVIHFEICCDDTKRAVQFYTTVFGWKASTWSGPMEYWLLDTGKDEPGIHGAIMKRQKPLTGCGDVTAYVCTIGVPSVDEYAARVQKAGGKVLQPKSPIPGVGWFCQCLDTEGNEFGIMQADPKAK